MLFETDKDRENEVEYIKKIEKKFLCESAKLPLSAGADYFLVRNRRLVCVAEIKCRNCASTDFDTTIVGKEKIQRARKLTRYFGHYDTGREIPLVLFFRFTDKDAYFLFDSEPPLTNFKEETIRRKDREHIDKGEFVHIHIPIKFLSDFND